MTPVFRQVIGHFTSGVVVITAVQDEVPYGMTVSAVCSLSLDPPMLLACLNTASRTQEAVRRSGLFAVNILGEQQGELAERFARPGDRFAGLRTDPGRTGVPLLPGALATVECRVAETVSAGTHRVFLAEVVHAEAAGGSPLAYFRGRFGKFEPAQDAQAYRTVRRLVLDRLLAPGEPVGVEPLADRLGVPPSSVYYALTRLVGDRLVRLDARLGHVVAPLDAATSDDTHDAKLAIELGAAALVAGRLSAEQLASLRSLAVAAASHVRDGRFTDVDGYIRDNHAFHRYLVDATGVRALADAYEHLSLPDVMARALPPGSGADPHLVRDHFELVDALERADLPAVRRVLTAHNEHAKATQRAGIRASVAPP
ncbi:flavin reductase [Actinoplanes sp. URMC 104]|uniref:flavin reductase n=1 Tax=Actinoplanes sp. URMC 104 TaxID=3423409 RepID=UPI003F1C599E